MSDLRPAAKLFLWFAIGIAIAFAAMFLCAVLFFAWMWTGRPTRESYVATVRSAATRLPIAVQFEKLFPGETDHAITHYGFNYFGGERTNAWNSIAYFGGRYRLALQVEVEIDYRNNTVTRAGDPAFYLTEITDCDGTSITTLGAHAVFGEKEWQEIYEKGGDFSVVGVTIRKDDPVPNVEQAIKAARSDIIPVSLLDPTDEESKQTRE